MKSFNTFYSPTRRLIVSNNDQSENVKGGTILIIDDADDLKSENTTTQQEIEPKLVRPNSGGGAAAVAKTQPKAILNAAIDPSAQQNATVVAVLPPIATKNTKLTEFFPVRRSVRKTKKAVEQEQLRNIEAAIRNEQEDGLVVQEFPHKGRGIMAARRFTKGEFVIEYIGDLITMTEANRREQLYAKDENTGCYMYYFKHKNQQHW